MTTLVYRQRCALLGRMARALRALNTGRITGDTFDRLQERWTALEAATAAQCYYHPLEGLDGKTVRILGAMT